MEMISCGLLYNTDLKIDILRMIDCKQGKNDQFNTAFTCKHKGMFFAQNDKIKQIQ